MSNQIPRPSYLATKYGHPTGGEHDKLYGSQWLKSGLTPLNFGPFFTNRYDLDNLRRWEAYQQDRFDGFVTNELEALESLAPLFQEGLDPVLDNIPIHPMYARENWTMELGKHLAPYPLKQGREGFWHASNDVVWDAMVPALKLASKFLSSGHAWHWLDALVSGQQEPILQHEVPNRPLYRRRQYRRFRLRHPRLAQQDTERAKVQNRLLSIAKILKLGLMSGHNMPLNGLPDDDTIFLGKSMYNPSVYEKVRMIVAIELVEPLLRTDLNPAERATDTFRLASLLVHETAHVLWIEPDVTSTTRYVHVDEPFFEDEVVSELGFSLQNALLGGIPLEFVGVNNPISEFGNPAGGMWRSDWNIIDYAHYSSRVPTLLNVPQSFNRRDRWPIPAGFFLDICQELYWDTHVRRFGSEGTMMGPISHGRRLVYPPLGTGISRISETTPVPPPVPVDYELPDLDKKALDFENAYRERASRIRAQMAEYSEDLRETQDIQDRQRLRGQAAQPDPQLPPQRPNCPRFEEIRRYIKNNRLELALDTLDFPMPEHVMYAHILRRGGIKLTADEWRTFLELCNFRRLLFTHSKKGTGYLKRHPIGWPTTSLRSRPSWPTPSRKMREHFVKVSEAIIEDEDDVFFNGYLDHDKDHFRQLCRDSDENWPDHNLERISEFEPALFESLLYWCYKEDRMFTYGPEGIIRRVKEGDPRPKTSSKSFCPQM